MTTRVGQVFATDADQLLAAVRSLAVSGDGLITDETLEVLYDAGLVAGEAQLTDSGLALFRTAWVMTDRNATAQQLGAALRALVPLQVLNQELRGYGPVPEDGVWNLLRQHRAIGPEVTLAQLRATLRWLNTLGVLVYSNKLKTVRFVPDDPEAAKPGESPMLAAVISPRTPFSNLARLRRLLRSMGGVVTWADPHFGARAFEELIDEVSPADVSEIRIISGTAESVLTKRSFKDYERFREEMGLKGIAVEWRVDAARDWHDRFLVHRGGAFNIPPVNSLFQNQYAEILPSTVLPPVEEWWARSVPRAN